MERARQRSPQSDPLLHKSTTTASRRDEDRQNRVLQWALVPRPHSVAAQQCGPEQDRVPRLRPLQTQRLRESAQTSHGLGHTAGHSFPRIPLLREQRQVGHQTHIQPIDQRHSQGSADNLLFS